MMDNITEDFGPVQLAYSAKEARPKRKEYLSYVPLRWLLRAMELGTLETALLIAHQANLKGNRRVKLSSTWRKRFNLDRVTVWRHLRKMDGELIRYHPGRGNSSTVDLLWEYDG